MLIHLIDIPITHSSVIIPPSPFRLIAHTRSFVSLFLLLLELLYFILLFHCRLLYITIMLFTSPYMFLFMSLLLSFLSLHYSIHNCLLHLLSTLPHHRYMLMVHYHLLLRYILTDMYYYIRLHPLYFHHHMLLILLLSHFNNILTLQY